MDWIHIGYPLRQTSSMRRNVSACGTRHQCVVIVSAKISIHAALSLFLEEEESLLLSYTHWMLQPMKIWCVFSSSSSKHCLWEGLQCIAHWVALWSCFLGCYTGNSSMWSHQVKHLDCSNYQEFCSRTCHDVLHNCQESNKVLVQMCHVTCPVLKKDVKATWGFNIECDHF